MSRYSTGTGSEIEYETGSQNRVLKNKLHIISKAKMDALEADSLDKVQLRYFTEDIVTKETALNTQMICQMHYDWLGRIYEWAGKYRSVDISKGYFTFPPAFRIQDNMQHFEYDLLNNLTPCHSDERNNVCASVAKVHAEFLLIHPFREGNGRIARWIANIMFAQADMTLPNYGFTGIGSKKRREQYLEAVIRGYYKDYLRLTLFFEEALERGYAEDLMLPSALGEAPSNTDDS